MMLFRQRKSRAGWTTNLYPAALKGQRVQSNTQSAGQHPYQFEFELGDPRVSPPDVEIDENGEPWIRTPQQHAKFLHEGGKGIVTLAQKFESGKWHEKRYPVEVAIEVLRYYQGRRNVYLSQQRFRARRTIAQLLSLSSLYVDLDFYGTRFEGWHPSALVSEALDRLERAGIPSPTLAICSGRGVYLTWQVHHLKRSALPRWNACQRALVELLRPLGADAAAKDCTRVLRLVGTTNGGNAQPSLGGFEPWAGMVGRAEPEPDRPVSLLLPVGQTYDFNDLADKILPLTTAELHDLRIRRAMRAAKRPSEATQAAPEGYTSATLWEARLTDLQRLRELRFMDEQMRDYRHRWLWIAGAGMSWLASSPAAFRAELVDLAREAGGWHEQKTRRDLGSVIRTTEAAFRREKVEYGGIEVDPRFRFTNNTIIELLEVDAYEESQMRSIISDDTRRKRARERAEVRRREAGAMPRSEYLSRSAERRESALRMRQTEGMSYRRIAEVLGISKSQVHRLLSESEGGCP